MLRKYLHPHTQYPCGGEQESLFYFLLAFLFFIEFRERKADVKIRSHSSSGTNVIREIHLGSLKFEIDFAFFCVVWKSFSGGTSHGGDKQSLAGVFPAGL